MMTLRRILFHSALVPACLVLAACGNSNEGNPGGGSGGGSANGAGGETGSGGSSSGRGGSFSGTGGASAGTGGAIGGSGGSNVGSGGSGNGMGGSATGAGGVAGTDGGRGNGGAGGGAGAGGGGAGGGSGGGTSDGGSSGSPGTPNGEDDGADCTVAGLPDSGSLSTNTKLPDPFKKLDGTRMTAKAEWRCRREEIKKMAEKYAFGAKPATPQSGVTGTVSNTNITVNVTDGGKSTTFSASVKLPTSGTAPYPAIVVYGGASFGAPLDNAVVNSEGVAIINYDPYAVGQEGTGRANKQGAFYGVYGSTSTTGLLVAWGWGVSRIIDVIEKSDGKILQADAVGVTGCSRFGKGAFLAGVFDQRVALTMPIESGTAGVPIWRGVPGEGAQSLSSAYGEQPWFGDAFTAFTAAPTKAPLDTHELVAMVAPRGLFIMDNPHIANLGPKSAHVAALAGAEFYKALGAGGNITYWSDVQNGAHCSMRPEWSAPLKSNIEKFLKKTGSDPGVIKASSSASGNLADWIDWTTPTLQ